jgi:hypothetical protein
MAGCGYDLPVKVTHHDLEDLVHRLQAVTLRGYKNVRIYEKAVISYTGDIRSVYPAQEYVLTPNIELLHNLSIWLQERHTYNLFNLNGWLELEYEDGRKAAILPPIVEHDNTLNMNIICDGMHRFWLARATCRQLSYIYISGVDYVTYPYYAYPVGACWLDVKEVPELTETTRKKFYRKSNPKDYYRNFNTAFPFVGESRGHGNAK